MRTNLFLSTLVAVSLVAGAALAEKPTRPVREPRAIQALRIHGDLHDKTYGRTDKAARASSSTDVVREVKNPLRDTAASRINCSDTGADCSRAARPAQAGNAASASRAGVQQNGARNPVRQRVDARVNCNEADECSASSKATQAKWAGAGTKVGKGAVTMLSPRDVQPRLLGQAGSDRMVCNEADECMMSSKAAKKIWAVEAIKAGTFRGAPADATPTRPLKTNDRASQQRDTADRQVIQR